MLERKNQNILRVAVQLLFGTVAVALATLACFRLGVNLATATCLLVIVVVLLSLWGNLFSAAVISIIAVGCLDYYFAPPIYSLEVSDPFDLIALALFLHGFCSDVCRRETDA